MHGMTTQNGLTLVELVVTLAVAAILLAVAVPAYTNLMVSGRLTTTANDFVAALNQARAEAVRRNTTVIFCSNSSAENGTSVLGNACISQAGAVYVLDSDAMPVALYEAPLIPDDLSLGTGDDAVTALTYSGNGLASLVGDGAPYSGLIADISSSRISDNNHRCLYMATGSSISSCSFSSTDQGCPSSEPTTCH
ncbi:prepilin-type N-terminal cleavage/methylation domain-containing protein [Solimonas sp. C16B3]|uniref:Type II secretion system protein H n=2 Tax=Solimonas marina TaxID=2714601 RepID=A0A970B709_9GAMM|nr:prepilin-type N-terminal cleavage/methylation domain-containing protein [Solimonas marina]